MNNQRRFPDRMNTVLCHLWRPHAELADIECALERLGIDPDMDADELRRRIAGMPDPLPPEVAIASIDEARIEMVHDLHRAVYGDTWARPESPEQVWNMLLDAVRASDCLPCR